MPVIRNSILIKRFTDFFKLKRGDTLDSDAGKMLVPVISLSVPPVLKRIVDVALNDSDKTLTVPSGKQWKWRYGLALFVTSATVGNRRIILEIRDAGGNNFYRMFSLNATAASTTDNFVFGNFGDTAEDAGGNMTLPIPTECILDENFQIRIFDSAAVDAAADDLTIRLVVEETDVTGE